MAQGIWSGIHEPIAHELHDHVIREETREAEDGERDEHEVAHRDVIEDAADRSKIAYGSDD